MDSTLKNYSTIPAAAASPALVEGVWSALSLPTASRRPLSATTHSLSLGLKREKREGEAKAPTLSKKKGEKDYTPFKGGRGVLKDPLGPLFPSEVPTRNFIFSEEGGA